MKELIKKIYRQKWCYGIYERNNTLVLLVDADRYMTAIDYIDRQPVEYTITTDECWFYSN